MMEPNNPSSKQMESSEGSCGTNVEASGSEAQQVMARAAAPALAPARKEPVSGPQEELEELPTDLLQDMEEPSSGPRKEIEDPPNDLLQDVEESCNGSCQGDPRNQSSERMEEASVNLIGVQAGPRGNGDTNLEVAGEEHLEEGQGEGNGDGAGQGDSDGEGQDDGEDQGEGEGQAEDEGYGEGNGNGEGQGEGKGQGEGEGHAEDEGDGEGQGEGKGQDEGEGQAEDEGDGKGNGDGEGQGDGKGQGEGEGQGNGESEGDGEGEGQGDGKGQGEGEGQGKVKGQGEGEGEGQGEGNGEGEDQDDGDGKGQGDGNGEGQGEGKGQGDDEGEGQGEGEGHGQGEDKGDGEGEDEGDGKGKDEGDDKGEGKGQGDGKGEDENEGNGEGEGQGKGDGEGQGDGDGEDQGEGEGEGQDEGAPGGAMSVIRSVISLYLRMQDLTEQQRVAEEILVRGMAAGCLPSPRCFSGDRREYHGFIVLCQLILQSCPRTFCSDQQRVHFVLSHLSGMALRWAKTLLEQNSPLMSNFPAFLEAMSEVFEYRQSLRVAEDAMFNIRQGERSATEYITEFQSLVPILRWPDEVLQAHLCQGLNEDIRHYLFRVPQPDSLDSLVVLILQIEEKLAERRAVLRLPPEARPRNLTWIDSPAPERWMVSSWLPSEVHPEIHRAHLFLLLMVRVNPYHSVAVQALVDSGAEGNFMDEKFAQEHYVELYEKPYPQSVQCADGSLIGDEPVWLYTEPLICIHRNHQESIQFDILPSPNFSVVLGIHWLRIHAPDIDWIQGRCTFHSPYCLQNCFRPPPPCIALERHGMSLLPGLPSPYSDLADVFNPREADEETSDQPSSDGSDDLSEPEPSELQQAGDSDRSGPFHGCPSARQRHECPLAVPREPVGARVWEQARQRHECWALRNMLTDRQDYIQLIPELFDQLHGAVWFTRLELRGSVVEDSVSPPRPEDMWRAAFGLELQDAKSYQPFPLSPDPVIPQRVMHFILKDMLGFFVLSSGQEVLVFSMSQEEHLQHVRQVLLRFRHHHVYCSLDRSQFHRHTAEFLGFVLTPKGVKLNKHTVSAITDYPQPTSRRGLRGFLKLVLPYRHFVERFSVIAEPLARQLLADAYDDHNALYWGEAEQEAFDGLRRAFRRAPLLHHPKPQHQFYLQTGATSTMLHASLIQIDDQTGKRVPCAFYSRPMSPLELGASAVEMRLLPIRAAFVVWCRYLENTEEPIMILLNTEDLASLNNDRLTVLLPGHWVFFFSHFHFDVMERPEQDGEGQSQLTPPGCNPQGSRSPRSLLLFAARRSQRGPSGNGEGAHDTDDEDEDMPDREDEAAEQNLARELLALIPAHQILHSFLAHFSMAQIRAVVLHFFRGLLYWKSVLGLAAMLVLLRARRRRLCLPPAPPPTPPPSPSASAPQRHSLRLILDSSLLAGSGMASAAVQLLTQMPPLVGANTLPAHELLELFLGPGPWRHHALLPATHRGLHFTPGFWLMLCEFFGFRVTPPGRGRSLATTTTVPPRHFRYLELHVVGDEDVVLREALQDDLQRYRQSGLRDGLQDTSQDARANDVPRALLPAATTDVHTDVDAAHATANTTALPLRPRSLLHPEVLDFLQHRLLHIRGTDGRLTLLSQEQVARALSRFLTMASTWTPAATSENQQEPPEPEGDPEEDPDLD